MKILIDIGHPAHIHFFAGPIRILKNQGHDVIITSRKKEFSLDLLQELHLQHIPLSSLGKHGLVSLAIELIQRNYALLKVVRQYKPDIMAAIGGIFIAHVGFITRTPSLVFYDTENAKLQNALTYPFCSRVIVPRCYHSWVPKKRHIRYDGYHELSYLCPNRFKPDRSKAVLNGLAKQGSTFFIRLVSWQANHDIGESGWNNALLRQLCDKLSGLGKILISSEQPLGEEFEQFEYRGKISEVHHVLANCRLFIGESATMASESAVLGVPAIYAAKIGRGYTTELERKYSLVYNIHTLNWSALNDAIDTILSRSKESFIQSHKKLLSENIDVAEFVANSISQFPVRINGLRTVSG